MESFCTMYEEDVRPSLKQSTWLTKENIIQKKILPYLGKRKVSEITAKDVMDWHNQMRKLKTKNRKTAFANVSENDTWTIKHYF